jgi:hypothetical protein
MEETGVLTAGQKVVRAACCLGLELIIISLTGSAVNI